MPVCKLLTVNGVTKRLTEWAREAGITLTALSARLNRLGWPPERAIQRVDGRREDATRRRLSAIRLGRLNPAWSGGTTAAQKAEYARQWRKRRERHVRDREYRKRFGISVDDYETMLLIQDGVCAICRKHCGRGRLSVDHCHRTGRVRGLLCRHCNMILGLLKDDCGLIERVAEYLKIHKSATS